MQSRNEALNLVDTTILPPPTSLSQQIANLQKQMEAAQKKGAVSHVIAPIPQAGQIVEILGLTYKVTYSAAGRGVLHLELERPAGEDNVKADPAA